MTAVYARGPRRLAPFSVLLTLAYHADDAGLCWPSLDLIARKSRVVPRTVLNALAVLEGEGCR